MFSERNCLFRGGAQSAPMTPAQCRAARGLVDWTQSALAEKSGVTDVTIRNFEKGRTALQSASMQVVRSALQAAGVEFIDDERGEGVVKLRGHNRK